MEKEYTFSQDDSITMKDIQQRKSHILSGIAIIKIPNLILTNAAGGINPEFNAGDIILIKDHINLIPDSPLRGKNIEYFGTRFPDMSNAYCLEIQNPDKSYSKLLKLPH